MASFSGLASELGCPLGNFRDRWSAYDSSLNRGIFTIWEDRLERPKLRYVFGEADSADNRIGAKELRKHIKQILENGGEAFGIRCVAEDALAAPRTRKSFDSENLLCLRFTSEAGKYVAYIFGEATAESIKTKGVARVTRYPDALDDIDAEPQGIQSPSKIDSATSGYRRDPKIRMAVLKRAKGHCEYCKEASFTMVSGEKYLEAHHIIRLTDSGPDTLDNVIGLCPKHHRQAHYGVDARQLNIELARMLRKIRLA